MTDTHGWPRVALSVTDVHQRSMGTRSFIHEFPLKISILSKLGVSLIYAGLEYFKTNELQISGSHEKKYFISSPSMLLSLQILLCSVSALYV
jgi:hypothetical protein